MKLRFIWTPPLDNASLLAYYILSIAKYLFFSNIKNEVITLKEPSDRILNEKYESQMKKGLLDMLVLKLLDHEEKYGYQIISELREKSDGRFVLKEGTLYPVLYRLEDDALVASRWSEPQGKGKGVPRKYYVLTGKGKQALSEITFLWKDICLGAARIMEEGCYEQ